MAHRLEPLEPAERECLDRYLVTLRERLGAKLRRVVLFGSAARGDMWRAMPIRSDIDLLVLTEGDVDEADQEELANATFPLFLECGRQIAPQFRTVGWFASPPDRHQEFVARIHAEGVDLIVGDGSG